MSSGSASTEPSHAVKKRTGSRKSLLYSTAHVAKPDEATNAADTKSAISVPPIHTPTSSASSQHVYAATSSTSTLTEKEQEILQARREDCQRMHGSQVCEVLRVFSEPSTRMKVLRTGLHALIKLKPRDGAEDTYCREGIKIYVRAIAHERLCRVSDLEILKLQEIALANRDKWLSEKWDGKERRQGQGKSTNKHPQKESS